MSQIGYLSSKNQKSSGKKAWKKVKWEHSKQSLKSIAMEFKNKGKKYIFRAIGKSLKEKAAFEDRWFSWPRDRVKHFLLISLQNALQRRKN